MVFSNSFFIFAFLPVTMAGYYLLLPWRKMQNIWLVLVSLFFYAWGEPRLVLLMLLSIVMNYIFGLWIDRRRGDTVKEKGIIVLMLFYNLSLLFVFKYMNFVCGILGLELSGWNITLPIGISFYTFQAISYVIDVYRGQGEVQKNPLNVALYIAFFPQLIAGPIVRYQTIADQIEHRKESWSDFSDGVERFIIGLSKKLILANSFAPIADYAFGHISELSGVSAWIGALCYTFQIYFDFSGYSDMAIGLGKMFGFQFLENFRYPYLSVSVSEFWRRWHISLGSWFRDYVYIPLGGSRVKTKVRLIGNLFVVWTLTGIWHGANWTFLLWGLWYFLLLTFEKMTGIPQNLQKKSGKILYYIFTILCVIWGWVLFRADSVQEAFAYIRIMLVPGKEIWDSLAAFWLKDLKVLLLLGVAACTPLVKNCYHIVRESKYYVIGDVLKTAAYIGLFLVCISYCVNSSYNPFIYFNF